MKAFEVIPDHSGPPVSTPKSAAREINTSVTTREATRYTVRNGWAWAHVFVDHGVAKAALSNGGDRHWVNVSIISDYGSFGYSWTHIGGDWREFLSGLDMHYAMNKMMGERFRVHLDGEEAAAHARTLVLDDRRQGSISKVDARDLWDGIDVADKDDGGRAFFRSWDSWSNGKPYEREYYMDRWDKVNPQAEGFWSEIWPLFAARIQNPPKPDDGGAADQLGNSGTTQND